MRLIVLLLLHVILQEKLLAQPFTNPVAVPPLIQGTQFTLTLTTGNVQFYPGLSTSNLILINGHYLGPTLEFIQNDTVEIQVINNLNEATTIHWHGFHVPAVYDGGPYHSIAPGSSWMPRFRVINKAATYWYHAHTHMQTMNQVTRGLAGLIIVRDAEEAQLNLPRTYGVDDFPLVIQDRKYSLSGNFQLAALGDSVLINGTANAYLQLPAQVVRLRLLNGSNARVYNIGFSDNRYFDVIASDGSLLDQPVSRNRLIISNGERYEILLDLTGQQGSTFLMMSYATEMLTDIPGAIQGMGMDVSYLNGVDFPLMQIQVTAPSSNPISTVPNTLINLPHADTSGIARYRFKILSGQGMISMGNFFIDGKQFDINIINDTIILNDKELWEFVNVSNMAHPMHIHGVQFRIVQRNGNPPQAYETGWKDGVLVHSMESVKLVMRFESYSNDTLPYVYHCHNLAHEDMGMMLSFIVVDTSVVVSAGEIAPIKLTIVYGAEEWIIRHPIQEAMTAEVSDPTGRLIFKINQSVPLDEIRIPHTHLPAGLYLIRLTSLNNLFTVKAVR